MKQKKVKFEPRIKLHLTFLLTDEILGNFTSFPYEKEIVQLSSLGYA